MTYTNYSMLAYTPMQFETKLVSKDKLASSAHNFPRVTDSSFKDN